MSSESEETEETDMVVTIEKMESSHNHYLEVQIQFVSILMVRISEMWKLIIRRLSKPVFTTFFNSRNSGTRIIIFAEPKRSKLYYF